jgi:acetoin utilization protein AcuB
VKIAEVMSTPPRTIGAGQSVQEAARAMAEYKIGCLPVVEGKEIVGIVTETDLLHYFASRPER